MVLCVFRPKMASSSRGPSQYSIRDYYLFLGGISIFIDDGALLLMADSLFEISTTKDR
jgi:hypothetical protein